MIDPEKLLEAAAVMPPPVIVCVEERGCPNASSARVEANIVDDLGAEVENFEQPATVRREVADTDLGTHAEVGSRAGANDGAAVGRNAKGSASAAACVVEAGEVVCNPALGSSGCSS